MSLGRSRFGLRLAAGQAWGSLRLYWTGALLAVLLGIIGFSVQVPIRSLGQPAHPTEPLVRLATIPAADAGIVGTASSLEPAVLQARAVQQLYELLLILGWGALIIAGISMLSRFAAHAAGRGPEVGVRRAAGASRRDLVLAFLGEGGLLLLVILGIAVPVSQLVLRISLAAWPDAEPGGSLTPWAGVLLLGAVIAFGVLAPMRYAGGRFMRGGADGQVMLAVPTFQLAMSLMILMGGSALLHRAPDTAPAGDTGNQTGVLLSLETSAESPEARFRDIVSLLDAVGRVPGVTGVSLASPGTLLGLGRVDDVTTDCGACVRGQIYIRYDLHTATHYLVSPDTFAAQGLRLVSGRGFTAADRLDTQRVALVSRHLAVSGFEARGAVGRDLFLGNDWPNHPYRVIGVVDDAARAGIGGALEPLDTIYLSVLQHPPKQAELLVRGEGDQVNTSRAAMAAVAGAGGAWKTRITGPPDTVLASAVRPVRWFGRWFTVAGLVVLLGAVAGTFSTMRMWVDSMVAEVAARRAVGATRTRIVMWAFRLTAGVGIKGVLAGTFLYFAVLRVSLTNLIGHTPAWDPAVFAALAGLLLGAALLGAAIPTMGLLRKPIAALFS